MELFENEGYTHQTGQDIHREKTDVLLPELLATFLRHRYAADFLSESEISSIITQLKNISGSDYDANKRMLDLICNGFTFRREDKSQKDLFIQLINFEEPELNFFEIVNQVEIQGRDQLRIPDGIVYVNGLPLVVLEFKSAIKENTTIEDAYKQLTIRYRRDIPELFKYNAFVVISDGVNNKIGSLFSPYEYFYAWRKVESTDKEVDGISSLITMVKGLFRKDRLVKIIKDFVYFPDSSNSVRGDKETKIVCRYPQFFAAESLYKSICSAIRPKGNGKGGIYFGATGCGKSYTMVFLSRLLMKSRELNSPTIVVITDRTDLDAQLSKIFVESKNYIGDENVECIESRALLKEKLDDRKSGGVFLTTIQKFCEDIKLLSERSNIICISDEAHRSQNNLEEKTVITDKGVEHKYGFAKYLHDSLPNATCVGFTGTPIDEMAQVFGDVVESYTMKESVADGITVNLVYEGRAAKVILDQKKVREIEEYYAQCEDEGANEAQIAASKKAVANLDAIIGDDDVVAEVAQDFINHYETRVREGATVEGKAMFVCSNREIAYKLWQKIVELRPEWNVPKLPVIPALDAGISNGQKIVGSSPTMTERTPTMTNGNPTMTNGNLTMTNGNPTMTNGNLTMTNGNPTMTNGNPTMTQYTPPVTQCNPMMTQEKPIEKIKMVMTENKAKDTKGLFELLGNHEYRRELDRQFKKVESNFKIAIVVDMWITGFDVPSLDTIYIYKPLQKHTLIQTISRVNRTYKGKDRGLIVDYIGIKRAMNEALKKYTGDEKEEFEDTDKAVAIVKDQISVLNAMFNEFDSRGGLDSPTAIPYEATADVNSGRCAIFTPEYLEKINAIQLPNTKIKILQQLLQQVIADYKRTNKIKAMEFSERLKKTC